MDFRNISIAKLGFGVFVASAVVTTALTAALGGFVRIPTGYVGVRTDFNKQIEQDVRTPGSWNQNIIGNIALIPVRNIALQRDKIQPTSAENVPFREVDITLVYSLVPNAVPNILATTSPQYHAQDGEDTILLYRRLEALLGNAAYKAFRPYKQMEAPDNREKIEQDILRLVREELATDGYGSAVNLQSVQVRQVLPNDTIANSAAKIIDSQNRIAVKDNEIIEAQKESERMRQLTANREASIAYMNAQANVLIAQGIKDGKVNTIIIPSTLTALGSFAPNSK